MGGFPFGGGYFGLYSHTAGVVPPTPTDEAAGHAARRRQPFPVPSFFHVSGVMDLTLPPLSLTMAGTARNPVAGTISADLEAFLYEAEGISRHHVTATLFQELAYLETRLHADALNKSEAQQQRRVAAFKALSPAKQAQLLARLSSREDEES